MGPRSAPRPVEPSQAGFPTAATTQHHSTTSTSSTTAATPQLLLAQGTELDDALTGLAIDGCATVVGFGSLLSQRSARTTFPDLQNFRSGVVRGYRRVFAHTAPIFYVRGIARPATREVASLSVEPSEDPQAQLVVSLFDLQLTPAAIAAWVEREHEFRFVVARPLTLQGEPTGRHAVMCAAYTDEEYRARRCPPDEFHARWGIHGIEKIWDDGLKPCRVYLRHCVLAAQSLGPEAHSNFLDSTYLGDRKTSIRAYLEANPDIMAELPPPELVGRYSG